MKAPIKHAPYFELLEALRNTASCAPCDLETRAQRRYFDAILYESVNDPGVRGALEKSAGYCPRHAHQLLGFQDALGIAILYRDQVRIFRDLLAEQEALRRRRLRRRPPQASLPGAFCPACRHQEAARASHLSTLAAWLRDEELRAALVAAPGPCAVHFLMLHNAVEHPDQRRFLIETMARKLDALLDALDEFRRKSGHDGRGEPFGAERDAWSRAVASMVGAAGVF